MKYDYKLWSPTDFNDEGNWNAAYEEGLADIVYFYLPSGFFSDRCMFVDKDMPDGMIHYIFRKAGNITRTTERFSFSGDLGIGMRKITTRPQKSTDENK